MITMNKINTSYLIGPLDYVVPRDPEVGYIKVIIPAGATTVSFDVNILDDRRVEDDEIIGVTIYDLSLPYGFVLGRFSSANITITDNDGKLHSLC